MISTSDSTSRGNKCKHINAEPHTVACLPSQASCKYGKSKAGPHDEQCSTQLCTRIVLARRHCSHASNTAPCITTLRLHVCRARKFRRCGWQRCGWILTL